MAVSGLNNSSSSFSLSMSLTSSMSSSSAKISDEKAKDVLQSSDEELIQKVKNGELTSKEITLSYQMAYMAQAGVNQTSQNQGGMQNEDGTFNIGKVKEMLNGIDAQKIGYTGKKLSELSQDEAKDLVSDNGYFGVKKTSERMADFVINGSGGDLKRMQQGREGMIKGYKEAEATWGGKLPEISQKTLDAALQKIDKKIEELGGNALNVQA